MPSSGLCGCPATTRCTDKTTPIHTIKIMVDRGRGSTSLPSLGKSEDLATRQRQEDLEFNVSLSLNWQDGSVGKGSCGPSLKT